MSATPRPWIGGCCGYVHNGVHTEPKSPANGLVAEVYTEADEDLIVRAVNAFDALLAVAKAVVEWWEAESQRIYDETGYLPSQVRRRAGVESLSAKLKALDAAHPDWREWSHA